MYDDLMFYFEHRVLGVRVRVLVFREREKFDSYLKDNYGKECPVGAITLYRSVPSDRIVGEAIFSEDVLSVESLSHEITHSVALMIRWHTKTVNLGDHVTSEEESFATTQSSLLQSSLTILKDSGFSVDPDEFYIRRN